MEVNITNVPQSICNKLRESALNILKGQGNIAYGPIGSNIIFIGNNKKSSNLFKVLYNVTNSKVECQTDPCFRYKSFKFSSHTVAVAVYLKIFENYISKVKRSSTKDFVDNVVDISRNPNAGQRTTNPLKKGKEKQTKKLEKFMGHVDPCDVYGSPVQQPKQPNPPPNSYIVTLLKFVHRNVSTCYNCGGKFYHQSYPDAPEDLIVVSKTKGVFVNPVTHERTETN